MSWSQEQINALYAKVQKRAMIDADFRKELLQDSNAAIAKIAGQSLPDGFHIKVIENDPAYHATFVLPDMPSDELSDDELDQIAGGVMCIAATVPPMMLCSMDVSK